MGGGGRHPMGRGTIIAKRRLGQIAHIAVAFGLTKGPASQPLQHQKPLTIEQLPFAAARGLGQQVGQRNGNPRPVPRHEPGCHHGTQQRQERNPTVRGCQALVHLGSFVLAFLIGPNIPAGGIEGNFLASGGDIWTNKKPIIPTPIPQAGRPEPRVRPCRRRLWAGRGRFRRSTPRCRNGCSLARLRQSGAETGRR